MWVTWLGLFGTFCCSILKFLSRRNPSVRWSVTCGKVSCVPAVLSTECVQQSFHFLEFSRFPVFSIISSITIPTRYQHDTHTAYHLLDKFARSTKLKSLHGNNANWEVGAPKEKECAGCSLRAPWIKVCRPGRNETYYEHRDKSFAEWNIEMPTLMPGRPCLPCQPFARRVLVQKSCRVCGNGQRHIWPSDLCHQRISLRWPY